jgi:hypothetical protein
LQRALRGHHRLVRAPQHLARLTHGFLRDDARLISVLALDLCGETRGVSGVSRLRRRL